ncbi:hypothetical protein KCU99_g9129, partial [Aureobasidium melanogenum]
MSYALQQTDGISCFDTTQVNCPLCDQLMLHSTRITIPCHDGQGYHKSSCVNCLLMEMDDCCFEITEETLTTIDDYVECKLVNTSKHAQEATDHAIVNFLEYALHSVIYVDDAPTHAARTQTTAPCRNSAARHSDLEDSDVEIICNDLSEEESKSCTDLTNLTTPATPEDLPDYVDDDLPPPVDISMIFNEIFSDQEMSETTDKAQCDCPEWLEWMH